MRDDGLSDQQQRDLAAVRAALDDGSLLVEDVRAMLMSTTEDVLPALAERLRRPGPR